MAYAPTTQRKRMIQFLEGVIADLKKYGTQELSVQREKPQLSGARKPGTVAVQRSVAVSVAVVQDGLIEMTIFPCAWPDSSL